MKLTDAEMIEVANRMYPHLDTVKANARRQLWRLYAALCRDAAVSGSGVNSAELRWLDDFEARPDFDDLSQ